jgi:pimeloyl-ACP methyl ester carboxylesterase
LINGDIVKRHPSGRRPPDNIDQERRQLLGVAATVLAGSWLDAARTPAHAMLARTGVATMAPKTGPTFGTLKQVKAGVLDVGYVETGPPAGRVVLLLHGWPYDVHTYAKVAPRLETAGYRVIVPYLRGYGTTRFRSANTLRNGQQSALAQDAIAMMDALGIRQAIVGGCDWGARTANIMAALWPERCKGMVSVSGYPIGNRTAAGGHGRRRTQPAPGGAGGIRAGHHGCRSHAQLKPMRRQP